LVPTRAASPQVIAAGRSDGKKKPAAHALFFLNGTASLIGRLFTVDFLIFTKTLDGFCLLRMIGAAFKDDWCGSEMTTSHRRAIAPVEQKRGL
jgi:hypothetical protein